MKKRIRHFVAVLPLILCFFSCTNNNKEDNNYIMDTLTGKWNWIKTCTAKHGIIDNEFKSEIMIFGQNENASINYEVFVSDTLFSRGSFKYQEGQSNSLTGDIKLPHLLYGDNWNILFENTEGTSSKDTLRFYSGNPDDDMYYYQKIK